MVYVSNGEVLDSRTRSPWRLSFFSDLFWGVVEFVGLFFQSLVQPDLSKDKNAIASSRFSDGRGPPGFPGRRRMGRINHGAGPTPLLWVEEEEDEDGKRLHADAGVGECDVLPAG